MRVFSRCTDSEPAVRWGGRGRGFGGGPQVLGMLATRRRSPARKTRRTPTARTRESLGQRAVPMHQDHFQKL